MFFTRLGRIVAILILVIGILNLALGLGIATEAMGPYEAALVRYYPGMESSGEVINLSMILILGSIVLGILTEIRYAQQ